MKNVIACSNGACENNFDLVAALKGSPIVTRSGKKVRVITKTADNKLLVCVYGRYAYEDRNVKYNIDGSRWSQNSISPDDLMMAA
jgi:hypothetical protein